MAAAETGIGWCQIALDASTVLSRSLATGQRARSGQLLAKQVSPRLRILLRTIRPSLSPRHAPVFALSSRLRGVAREQERRNASSRHDWPQAEIDAMTLPIAASNLPASTGPRSPQRSDGT